MALLGMFGRKRSRDTDAATRIKAWVVKVLDSGPDTVVAVNEIACNDPGCPGIETVILIMIPGEKTRACKVQMPLDEVGREDVRVAIELHGASGQPPAAS